MSSITFSQAKQGYLLAIGAGFLSSIPSGIMKTPSRNSPNSSVKMFPTLIHQQNHRGIPERADHGHPPVFMEDHAILLSEIPRVI